MSPTSPSFREDIGKMCGEVTDPVIGRNKGIELGKLMFRPTADSWLNRNDRGLDCMLQRADKAKLTAPLK